ncbi:hypothetical protein IWW45_006674, partial [Coemansia sp. RSA 485]
MQLCACVDIGVGTDTEAPPIKGVPRIAILPLQLRARTNQLARRVALPAFLYGPNEIQSYTWLNKAAVRADSNIATARKGRPCVYRWHSPCALEQ